MFGSVRFFYDPMALGGAIQKAGAPLAASVQAALGVAQLLQSRKQHREADKLAANTIRPTYTTPQPIKDNLALAESRAAQGLSDGSLSTYENNMDRTLTTQIDAILRGGGSANTIGDLYDRSEDSFANLALLEEEMRLKNTQAYMAANNQMADYLDSEFQINQWAPFKDTQQAIAALRAQAATNKSNGLNTIGSAAVNYLSGTMGQNDGRSQAGNSFTAPSPVNPVETIGFPRSPSTNAFLPTNPVAPDIFGMQGASPTMYRNQTTDAYKNFFLQSILSNRR